MANKLELIEEFCNSIVDHPASSTDAKDYASEIQSLAADCKPLHQAVIDLLDLVALMAPYCDTGYGWEDRLAEVVKRGVEAAQSVDREGQTAPSRARRIVKTEGKSP